MTIFLSPVVMSLFPISFVSTIYMSLRRKTTSGGEESIRFNCCGTDSALITDNNPPLSTRALYILKLHRPTIFLEIATFRDTVIVRNHINAKLRMEDCSTKSLNLLRRRLLSLPHCRRFSKEGSIKYNHASTPSSPH
ncbi:hypothetical protein V1509DRAFT_50571 [Lipomyces kononenkoae]